MMAEADRYCFVNYQGFATVLPGTLRPEKHNISSFAPTLARAPFNVMVKDLSDGLDTPEVYVLTGEIHAVSEAALAALENMLKFAARDAQWLVRGALRAIPVLRATVEAAPIDQISWRSSIKILVVPKQIREEVW
jgi:hypothetical protein